MLPRGERDRRFPRHPPGRARRRRHVRLQSVARQRRARCRASTRDAGAAPREHGGLPRGPPHPRPRDAARERRRAIAAAASTGIAFCSETELLQKRDLVARRELALTSREAKAKPQRERSAHVIWGEIERAGNAFRASCCGMRSRGIRTSQRRAGPPKARAAHPATASPG